MSVNVPPNPNVSTFNNLYWIHMDTALTTADADLRYLKWNVAQGDETLQGISVNGNANFYSQTNFNNVATGSLTSLAVQPASNDSSTKIPTTAWVQTAVGPGGSILATNNTFTGTNAFNNISPPTSTSTQPADTDSSTKIPTTAWVQLAIAGGGSANVYSQSVFGNFASGQYITIPTNCIKFDVILLGNGGDGSQYTTNTTPPYFYEMPGAGGGCQAVSSTIYISKQGQYITNTLQVFTGSFSSLFLNNEGIAGAANGNPGYRYGDPVTNGATTTTPVCSANYNWIVYQGGAGGAAYTTTTSPYLSIGGGNVGAGVFGNGSTPTQYNANGQGQQWTGYYGILQLPNLGVATPFNYGGCIITWYIEP